MSSTPLTIAERRVRILARIARACERAGRDPESVTMIAVTKTHDAATVVEAVRAGFTQFGENRVQEGLVKIEAARQLDPLRMKKAEFHLIGHLQTNKARAAANAFAMIHSVDSQRLLEALNGAPGEVVRCMVEVNITGEESKFGVSPEALPTLLAQALMLPNIEIEGLMTVAPNVPDPEQVRPVFRKLAELAREHDLGALSMGMTSDYEVAIEEGATHVRIGRAIFGERA